MRREHDYGGDNIVNLYHLKNQTLTPVLHQDFKLEKDLQAIVESNLETLFGLRLVSSEFFLGELRLDTLAFDEENQAFVIIEYKRGHNYSVIDQGYSYLSLMLNNKADFILEFNEKQNQTLQRSKVNWASSRVIFLSPSFNKYQKNSVNFKDIPFELWEARRFDGDIISIDQVVASSKESIKKVTSTKDNSVISQVSAEVQVFREEDHVTKLSDDLIEVWAEFREMLDEWPDTYFYARQPYIGFKRGNKTVCFIHFQKQAIRIDITRGEKTKSGKRGNHFFDLDDYKKIAEEKKWTYQSGRTGHKYSIILREKNEIRYILELIEQKFKSV